MKDRPLVSIGIITYNHKEFIKECIDSVLAQDYENMEIVIADGGSTDGTQQILEEYCKEHPDKIVLKISKTHRGITKNSNVIHFSCKGKYIAWVAGDDLILPGKIKKQIDYMEAHPECAICYHNLEIFDSDTGKILGYYNNSRYSYEGDVKVAIIYGVFNGDPSSMVRREKAPKHGFDERIPISSDWLYWIETLANGGEIHYIDEILGKYRRHKGNITLKQPTVFMLWEKLLTLLIVGAKYPHLIKYYPCLIKNAMARLSHNFLKTPKGMVIIKGASLLRAYTTPR